MSEPKADLSAFDQPTIDAARKAVREYMEWIADTGGDTIGKLSPFAQDALIHQFAFFLSRRAPVPAGELDARALEAQYLDFARKAAAELDPSLKERWSGIAVGMRTVLDALASLPAPSAHPPAVAVPEGWRLVPIRPTSHMTIAGHDAGEQAGNFTCYKPFAEDVWDAMLAASPNANPQPAVDTRKDAAIECFEQLRQLLIVNAVRKAAEEAAPLWLQSADAAVSKCAALHPNTDEAQNVE